MKKTKGRPRYYHLWPEEKRKEYHRACHLRTIYGMTVAEWDQVAEWQNGVCCICGGENPSGKRLAVDHDHETEQNRNLLCASCNKGLGLFKDNSELLENALLYLLAWKNAPEDFENAVERSAGKIQARKAALRECIGASGERP